MKEFKICHVFLYKSLSCVLLDCSSRYIFKIFKFRIYVIMIKKAKLNKTLSKIC